MSQEETITALTRALQEIVNVLGPNIPDCEVNVCHGCKQEAATALSVAKTALESLKTEGV
jgi:hypothetical protein